MLGFLFKKGLKLTGLGLTIKELNDYRKKMKSEGKDPLSPKNFIDEYGKPLYDRVTSAIQAGQGKAGGGMMEMRKKGMGLKMANGGSALKPIPADNKGLPNLPQDVRNKMGFMKKGGMVKKRAKSTAKKSRGMGIAKRGGNFKGSF